MKGADVVENTGLLKLDVGDDVVPASLVVLPETPPPSRQVIIIVY